MNKILEKYKKERFLMGIYKKLTDLIGKTPLLELTNYENNDTYKKQKQI